MDSETRIVSYATLMLLILVTGMLFFLNHQLDSVKHAVGAEESEIESQLHEEATITKVEKIETHNEIAEES